MSQLSRFLAANASEDTKNTYNAITASSQTINNTIHIHMAPDSSTSTDSNKRRKKAPPIIVDPSTYHACYLNSEICRSLDPSRSALTSEVKLKFVYPDRVHKLAFCYDYLAKFKAHLPHGTNLEVYPDTPATFGNAIIESALIAQTLLPAPHAQQLSKLRILTASDECTDKNLPAVMWQFYTENPLAIAALTAPPNDRKQAAKNHRAFLLPCPICNPCCSALRDRLNTEDIYIPNAPRKGGDGTLHENAITKYLSIPNLINHCQTVTRPSNEPFVIIHRYLAHLYNCLDSAEIPLYTAIDNDLSSTPGYQTTEEPLDSDAKEAAAAAATHTSTDTAPIEGDLD